MDPSEARDLMLSAEPVRNANGRKTTIVWKAARRKRGDGHRRTGGRGYRELSNAGPDEGMFVGSPARASGFSQLSSAPC
jgi:hypothetical protein